MKSPPASNSWNGRFIGDNQRYRLDKRIAAGGMGEVYLATDTRVGQQVALKLLKDTLVASAEMRQRFEREIAVCAALQSDHIVKISDCGVTPEGFPFYVMEYLRGQTLRQLLLSEKRLSVERTAKIIAQVCKGLHLAHQGVTLQREGKQGPEHIKVIHRDLKPDNIFLVPTDLGEWVKILDFGVAKIRNDSSDQTNITNTFIGTFRYAAPEQIQNDRNLDPRADIYSLGIILYEMLTAADPFGLSVKNNNISEASWVLAHTYEPPKPLREQPGCEQLPLVVEAVVIKCLQKNPQNRFASVQELDQALQAAVNTTVGNTSNKRESTIVQPQPARNQGANYDTVERPLTPVVPNQSEDDTIIRPKPLQNQSYNDETVERSLNYVPPSQSADDTIVRSSTSQTQNPNHDTVPGVLNPGTIGQSEDETILRSPTVPNQAANHETVDRPLKPVTPSGLEGTILQGRPSQNHGVDPNVGTASGTNQAAISQPDGTLFQPRPNTHSGGQPTTPDGTLFQPRPNTHSGGQPTTPEGTLYQPRPNTHSGGQPTTPEGTLFQPRRDTQTGGQANTPDGTLFQPRRDTQSSGQQLPENTIVQQKKDTQPQESPPGNVWRTIGIFLALGIALGAIIYIYPRFNIKNSNNGPGVPTLNPNLTR